jgi:hypothetical protein
MTETVQLKPVSWAHPENMQRHSRSSRLDLMICTVRSALKTSEESLADERARSAEANACAAEVGCRLHFNIDS